MTDRWVFAALVSGVVGGALLASCGTTATCDSSCAGCCSAGMCVAGTETSACGVRGAACVACQGSCVSGQCSGVAGGGSAGGGTAGGSATGCGNCRGCCDNGVCRSGAGVDACGSDGGVCSNCLTANRICVAGQCQTQCSSLNCTGCCRNNQCITTTTVDSCGRGGEACVTCEAGESCTAGLCGGGDGGMRADAGSTCQRTCNGCCDVADTCQVGTSSTACGAMGNRCQVCNCNVSRGGGGRCS